MNRWTILLVLFVARTAMGFQFQAVAATSPFLQEGFGVSLAQIGVLIGLYLLPGVVVALPGGAAAAWVGEKRMVLGALVLMLVGSVMALFAPDWPWVTAGRLLAGAGGVVLNIVMTKLLADWFAGKELSTAMAIFINSWPIGIALALLVLPPLALSGGLYAAELCVLAVVALGLVTFAFGFQPAPGAVSQPRLRVVALPWLPLVLAGVIWGLYNVALAMVFSFAPSVLSARGMEVTAAGSMTSLFMVIFSISVPLGGILADKTGRPGAVIAVALLSFVVMLPLVAIVPLSAMLALFVVMAILSPLGAGAVMALPATVLAPDMRAFGMGVFFTIYYLTMMLAPPLAGVLAEAFDTPSATMVFGAGVAAAALCCFVGFRRAVAVPAEAAP